MCPAAAAAVRGVSRHTANNKSYRDVLHKINKIGFRQISPLTNSFSVENPDVTRWNASSAWWACNDGDCSTEPFSLPGAVVGEVGDIRPEIKKVGI